MECFAFHAAPEYAIPLLRYSGSICSVLPEIRHGLAIAIKDDFRAMPTAAGGVVCHMRRPLPKVQHYFGPENATSLLQRQQRTATQSKESIVPPGIEGRVMCHHPRRGNIWKIATVTGYNGPQPDGLLTEAVHSLPP